MTHLLKINYNYFILILFLDALLSIININNFDLFDSIFLFFFI